MPASPDSAPAVPAIASGGTSRAAAASAAPVAVVWCRQVDNEAESPGYTTVPEDFPGMRETLDTIRIVGHLTVNIADTHDYWDPDPAQPLSYYPNIFLYPAFGGRYTCLGRMFLSTEDRPRLGMKTLVLDTQQLLASGDFGGTILRWHASMGGPRGDGGRPAPVPDPRLFDVIGEGFFFHKGSTEPVVAVASDDWEASVRVVLEMIRVLPASLVALGAILAFPYFLPQPKTNLHEFTEQLPTALAIMRVPRGEAAGDRHDKRMASWESAPVSLRDLTNGFSTAAKGKETTPLVLQFVRDHNAGKLGPIVQRVDLVEMPRLRPHLADPERQGGRDRRKEMWRIGTAMESAALLLQRARGRHVPVNVETAKRAQEYLQARLPEPSERAVTNDNEPMPVAVHAVEPTAGQHPPWLQRPGGAPEPPASPPAPVLPEVVPVSVSEDPSLLPASARPPAPLQSPAGGAPRASGAVAVISSEELASFRKDVTADLLRFVDERLAAQVARAPAVPVGLDPTAQQQVDGRLAGIRENLHAELGRQVGNLQERFTRDQASGEVRQREALTALMTAELDKRWTERVEPKLAEFAARADERAAAERLDAERRLHAEIGRLGDDLSSAATTSEENLRTGLAAQLDLHLAEAADREKAVRTALEALVLAAVDTKMREAEQRHAKELKDVEQRLTALSDVRLKDLQLGASQRAQDGAKELEGLEARSRALTEARVRELTDLLTQRTASVAKDLKDLENRLTGALDARQKDLQDRMAQRTLVEAKELKDMETRLSTLLDARQKEVQERVALRAQNDGKEFAALLDRKLNDAATKAAERLAAVRGEVTDSQVRAIADLQVRLQAYTDQRVREDGERDRQTYIELLARLKGEVDASIGRFVESPRFDHAVRERIETAVAASRGSIQQELDDRVVAGGLPLRADLTDLTERLQRLEANAAARRDELIQIEENYRSELDDLDRRAQILADRLVPVVRKTWTRITELERQQGGGAVSDEAMETLRRETQREVRRLETSLDERLGEIRDRMETSISNQGRVWLTLVRQLSQLTEDRRVIEESRAMMRERPPSTDEATNLEALPGLLQPRSRSEPSAPTDEDEDPDRARRRRRVTPR